MLALCCLSGDPCSQVLSCQRSTSWSTVSLFLDAARALPFIRFCLLNVDSLCVSVRDQLVSNVFDPIRPLTSLIESGFVLAFRSSTGLDAFGALLEDVTPGSMLERQGRAAVGRGFEADGLHAVLSTFTLVGGRAGEKKMTDVPWGPWQLPSRSRATTLGPSWVCLFPFCCLD